MDDLEKPLHRFGHKFLYHVSDSGVARRGRNQFLWGDCSRIWGNCSGLEGDASMLRGDCSGLRGTCTMLQGKCSGLVGDLDAIPWEERKLKPKLRDWIQ